MKLDIKIFCLHLHKWIQIRIPSLKRKKENWCMIYCLYSITEYQKVNKALDQNTFELWGSKWLDSRPFYRPVCTWLDGLWPLITPNQARIQIRPLDQTFCGADLISHQTVVTIGLTWWRWSRVIWSIWCVLTRLISKMLNAYNFSFY